MALLKYWLWLSQKKGIGSAKAARLLEALGTPEAIYGASPAELRRVEGITQGDIEVLADRSFGQCEEIQSRCERLNVEILTLQDAMYPERLRQITSPPCVLYIRGRLPAIDDEPVIAVVGTRSPSAYGQVTAKRLSARLAQAGAVIISGMAAGIDTAAHMGALGSDRPTVAVLGCGTDICYPKSNRRLYEDIMAYGALLSEYPPGVPPLAEHFPRRNRIMSGLSLGVVVVEAGPRSGALITAEYALEQGRDVFAVPGNIDSPASAGTNALIAAGAVPVTGAYDVLSEYAQSFPDRINMRAAKAPMGVYVQQETPQAPDICASPPQPGPAGAVDRSGVTERQQAILKALDGGPLGVDGLVSATGFEARVVLTNLTLLEMCGAVSHEKNETYALRKL